MHAPSDRDTSPRRIRPATIRLAGCRAPARPRGRLLLGLLLAAAAIGACRQLPIETQDYIADLNPPTPKPLFVFLSAASAGDTRSVADSHSGAMVAVTAGRAYHAASGRFCRRFRIAPPQTYEGLSAGLACRDARGHWTTSALLINPEDLSAPRLRHP